MLELLSCESRALREQAEMRLHAIAQKLGARTVSPLPDVQENDDLPVAMVAPKRIEKQGRGKYKTNEKREQQRRVREDAILRLLRSMPNTPLTPGQVAYRGFSNKIELARNDLESLYEKREVFKQRMLNRDGKPDYGYWVISR